MIEIEAEPIHTLVHKSLAERVAGRRWRETGLLLENIEDVCMGYVSGWRRWRLVESDG
jgi:hypothetical protein